MLKRWMVMVFRFGLSLVVLGGLGLLAPRLITAWQARARIFPVESVPDRRVAVVFGAGLWRDGRPTTVLRDRVQTAADLYFSGKVEKLLMSGDNRVANYNEPQAMREYAVSLGVPDHDIVLDYAGRSTYETCYRAREIFRVNRPVLVTQAFHLPRAIYTCRAFGLDAVGVPADLHRYRRFSRLIWSLRELPATLNAFLEVHLTRPLPVLGEVEPIFPLEAQ